MNSPWEQWSPYWWQSVTAVPPFGMSFESSSAYAQPNDGSPSQGRSTWPPPAAPGVNSGILGQLGPAGQPILGLPIGQANEPAWTIPHRRRHGTGDSEWVASRNRGGSEQLRHACPKQV
jgi:hypothetical protein